ncbi:hypothetical protein FHS29_006298 [Saccharothrix tamanrassetensis]|uniref:Allene oxide cyclase barrel-like domain-containing protein n=1 Tax=Saccharothrix tamanrassetensis TaxID=1051531 RepID=A0A841CUH1_9PSEU|nr:hypothetical protein [Saccharothrix tamanrassetensis]MBB5959677.1 hypothetical protein [Saccharothrix tamanrassetensis]
MRVQPWLVVLTLAGTLVGAHQVVDVRAHQVVDREATVELTAKRTLMSAPANISVGGGFVSGGELMDGQGGAKVGEGFSHCGVLAVSVTVPPEVTAHCTSTFRLADGDLHLSSLRAYKSMAGGFGDTTMAVIGGTGKYAGARGEGKATRATAAGKADAVYRFTITLVG